jgi:hypothetical protein
VCLERLVDVTGYRLVLSHAPFLGIVHRHDPAIPSTRSQRRSAPFGSCRALLRLARASLADTAGSAAITRSLGRGNAAR